VTQSGACGVGPTGMKKMHAGLLALAAIAIAIPALADPPAAPAPAPAASATAAASVSAAASAKAAPSASNVITVGSAVIKGRAAKPQVLIELQRQTPTSAAGAAHDQLREAMMKKLEPSTTRATR